LLLQVLISGERFSITQSKNGSLHYLQWTNEKDPFSASMARTNKGGKLIQWAASAKSPPRWQTDPSDFNRLLNKVILLN